MFILSYPPTDYAVHGLHGEINFTIATGLPVFIAILMAQGLFMALGKAAVFKHIPAYSQTRSASWAALLEPSGGREALFGHWPLVS